jgi:phosphatidyl-myo-inositol dimannoside synthase
MRIILLAADFPPSLGGIQQYVLSLARALDECGQEVHLVATVQPGSDEFDAGLGVPVIRVAARSKWDIWQKMRGAAIELAGGAAGTIVTATKWFPEGPAAMQAARSLGGVSAMIGYDREFALHGFNIIKWGMQKYVLGGCDIAYGITDFAVAGLRRMGVAAAKIHRLGGGVDSERFYPDTEAAEGLRAELQLQAQPVICTVSRLARHKGHPYVLQALRQVIEKLPDTHYVIVGEGPYRPELDRLVEQYGVGEHVTFAGRVSDEQLRAYYTMAEVMAMPSFDIPGHPNEGLGLTYLEANACGTPVIGADSGGVSEVIEDGASGLLVPPRDHRALAEALLKLLQDPEYAAKLGEYGRRRVLEDFSWPQVAERFVNAVSTTGSQ